MKKNDKYVDLGPWGNFKQSIYEVKRLLSPKLKLKKKPVSFRRGMTLFAYSVFALPILYFAVFYVYVNFSSFMLAFKDSAGTWTMSNFRYVISSLSSSDGTVLIAFRNTCYFFVMGLLLMSVNVTVSYTLYKKIFGYKIFQLIFFLPSIIGGMVWMSAYKSFIGPEGPLVELLLKLKLVNMRPEFLSQSRYAIQACLAASLWLAIPSGLLIYGGSLARIPQEIVESGNLEGINFFQEIYYITVPLIWPTISTNLIFAIIGFLGASGNILLLTQGRYQTSTLSYWLFEQVVYNDQYNIPAAAGLLMTAVTLPLTITGKWLAGKIESVEY